MYNFKIKINGKQYIIETKENISEEIIRICIKAFIYGYNKDADGDIFDEFSTKDKAERIEDVLKYVIKDTIEVKEDNINNFVIEI